MVVDPRLIGISGKIKNGKDLLFDVINYIITEDYWTSFEHFMHEANPVDVVYENKKFAYPIKWIISALIGCDIRQLEDRDFKNKELGEEWWQYGLIRENTRKPILYPSKKEDIEKQLKVFNNSRMYINKLTPRKLLQLLGTEAGRHVIHPNIWVNALFADYPKIVDMDDKGLDVYENWIITDVRFPNEANIIKEKGGIMIRINRPQYLNNRLVIGKNEHLSETALDNYDGFDYVIENDGTVQDLIDKVKSLNIVKRIL